MRDRRPAKQPVTTHDDESDKENVPSQQQRNTTLNTKSAALDGKRNRAAPTNDEQSEQQQQHGSNNKKSKPSHNSTSTAPLSPSPVPSFSTVDSLLADKDAAYSQLLDKYNELKKHKLDATATLVAQYEQQTNQLRTSSQQLTKHWQDKCEQLEAAQRKEEALRRKESEAAMAVKELALAEKDKQLKEKAALTAELESSLQAANQQLSNYLLLTGTSITAPSSSTSSSSPPTRLVCCMVNASNRNRRIDFVLDTSNTESAGSVEYRPKRIELGGAAYPKCLKGSMQFAVDRTPNFTRYLLDVLYKKAEEQDGAEKDEAEGGSEQLAEVEVQQQGEEVAEAEQDGSEQSVVEQHGVNMQLEQAATEAVTV